MEYTQNYALRKPGLNEYANVGDLNFNADKIDSQMKKNQDVDGEVYDPTSTAANAYEAGDYVINPEDGLMYVCNGTTYGTWDATKWEHTTEFEELQKAMASGGESELADLNDVDLTNPTEGQALLYDDTNDEWVNSDLPDADVTKEASGNPIEFEDGADAPLVKCTTTIQGYQEGTGTPSPDNVRPIHAYTESTISGVGKNKAKSFYVGTTLSRYSESLFFEADLKPSTTYTVSFKTTSAGNIYYSNETLCTFKTLIVVNGYNKITVKTVSNISKSNATQYKSGKGWSFLKNHIAETASINFSEVMVVEGSTDSPYEPYKGTTHTATYSQSIYQGNADFVGGGSPSVQCDWPCIDLGDLTWDRGATNISGKYRFYANLTTALQADTAHLTSVCETYGLVSEGATFGCANGYTINSSSGLWVYDSTKDNMTKEEFKSSVTGVKLTYRLATPTTETITPTNLPLKSLFGYNHIESSTGDMEIEYFPSKEQPLIDLIPEASNMHTYSTEEQVVGTWVDGKDVYEKTYVFSSLPIVNDWTAFDEDCGIDTLVDYSLMYTRSNGQIDNDNDKLRVAYNPPTGLGDLCYYPGGVEATHITVRYTKTSSNNRSLAKSAPQETEQVEELKEETTEEPTEVKEEPVEKAKEEETKEEGEVNER